nr:hypothetical protein [Tanacetum cinerariifolium]
MFRVLANVGNF